MFPHNFVVKEIEFWSGYNWGTIKLESSQARNVLLEHAKFHPFKPFTDGKIKRLILYLNTTKFHVILSILKTQKNTIEKETCILCINRKMNG